MTTGTLLSYVETKTQAPAGTLNSATGISFLNEAMIDLRSELIKKGIDAAQTQESYIATVTVPTYPTPSTFAYPSDMYVLKTIEVNMTDTTQQNYLVAQQVDQANLPSSLNQQTSFDFIRVNQPTNQPLFADNGDTFEIFPTFTTGMNLTNAIKIIYYLQPIPYTTTSDNLAYPDLLDVYILAERVAALYYESLNKFSEAAYWMEKSNSRLSRVGVSLARGSQQPIQPQGLGITGWEF